MISYGAIKATIALSVGGICRSRLPGPETCLKMYSSSSGLSTKHGVTIYIYTVFSCS